MKLELSNNHATIDETCLKLTIIGNTHFSGQSLGFLTNGNEYANKTLQFSCDVYTESSNWTIQLIYKDSSGWHDITGIVISLGSSTPTVTRSLPADVQTIWVRLRNDTSSNIGAEIFTTNWCLKII